MSEFLNIFDIYTVLRIYLFIYLFNYPTSGFLLKCRMPLTVVIATC